MSRFKGEGLSENLQDYHGIIRREGEDDWTLRKRAFIEIYPNDPVAAAEVLFARHYDTFTPNQTLMFAYLSVRRTPTTERLLVFVEGFRSDPALFDE